MTGPATDPSADPLAGNALGAFLRARRESTTPAAAGLPAGPRRRTPGLRRGELAALAGVSVEYLTRLERGRDRRPSPQVLAALAGALGLGEDEHVHLIRLVKAVDSAGVTQWDGACAMGAAQPVRPGLLALLDRLEPDPALIVDRVGAVLARTEGFRKLAGPSGLLDADCITRFVLTDPRARAAFAEWDAVADEWTVRLRAAADLGDPHAAGLATELALTAPGFAARYAAATRVPRWSGTELWTGTDGGELRLGYEALEVPATEEHRLLVYRPL